MESIYHFVSDTGISAFINTYGALITTIAFLSALFIHFKGKKRKEPHCEIVSSNIVNDYATSYENLKVTYKDKPIKNLTLTKLIFWNSGRETILRNHIPLGMPISIKTINNAEILDIKMYYPDNKKNKLNKMKYIQEDDKTIIIDFEYLSKNDGVAMAILHTGQSSEDILMDVNIIDSLPLKSKKSLNYYKLPKPLNQIFGGKLRILLGWMFVLSPLIRFILMMFGYDKFMESPTLDFINYVCIAIIWLGCGFYLLRRPLPNWSSKFVEQKL